MARIVLAGREVWPFVPGGGIGRYVWLAATMLAPHHEVTILTTAAHRPMADDPRLPEGVEIVFAEEPEGDVSPYAGAQHAWSARLFEAVAERAPDLVEFGDYLGEGFCSVHARRAGSLPDTAVVVRAHTSGEIAAALNESPPVAGNGLLWAMERFCIRHADAFLWPGGDVLDRYRAFYGTVAAPVELTLPVRLDDLAPPAEADLSGRLRILYLNRLERRKGIEAFARAVRASDADFELTIVGGDTDSGPGGGSMRAHVEALLAGDARVTLRDSVPHEQVPGLIAEHHAVAVPVRWETFSYVTREALAANRPVLATPAGAIVEVVRPGKSGWLGPLAEVTADAARAMIDAGGPRAALEASLIGDERLAEAYAALAPRVPAKPSAPAPRVGAVVTVAPGDANLDVTLRSLRAQRGAAVGVTVVAPPSAIAERTVDGGALVVAGGDRIALMRAGAAAAREDLLLLLPAGAELHPDFTRRAVAALDGFDYATAAAARGRRPWHAPLGGEDLDAAGVDAGASVALVRREALRPATSERELWSGLSGVVIPEPLVLRLPRRAAEPAEPANGGAPDAEAFRRAFGDLPATSAS